MNKRSQKILPKICWNTSKIKEILTYDGHPQVWTKFNWRETFLFLPFALHIWNQGLSSLFSFHIFSSILLFSRVLDLFLVFLCILSFLVNFLFCAINFWLYVLEFSVIVIGWPKRYSLLLSLTTCLKDLLKMK